MRYSYSLDQYGAVARSEMRQTQGNEPGPGDGFCTMFPGTETRAESGLRNALVLTLRDDEI